MTEETKSSPNSACEGSSEEKKETFPDKNVSPAQIQEPKPGAVPEDPKDSEIAKLTKELEEKKQELREIKNLHYRALADYDNLRKRTSKEVLEAKVKGSEELVKKLLSVLDTIESAMRQMQETKADKKVLDGFEMLAIQFSDILEKEGLKAIPAKGTKFDPNLHEAVCKSWKEGIEDEIIVKEFEKGYKFKDHVLRTAKVEINQQ